MLAEKDARRRKQERNKQRIGNIQKQQKKVALFKPASSRKILLTSIRLDQALLGARFPQYTVVIAGRVANGWRLS